jgi:hypothetical protein
MIPTWVFVIGFWLTFSIVLVGWLRRFPCSCGRARHPYFHQDHTRLWTMVFWALWASLFTVVNLITIDWIFSIIWALTATWEWRTVYFHEKDKLRSVIRGLGRVFVNQHGRLKVSTTDGN